MQCAVLQALLSHGALVHDGMSRISRQRQIEDCLAQGVEPLDATDEIPGALVHLIAGGDAAVGSDRVERGVPESHDPIGVASSKAGLVFHIALGELAARNR
jgi:hypothetical protein